MIGVETLLVYRECPCGEWCATGEGALAPICSGCGGRMVPIPTHHYDDSNRRRREFGLGFRARLASEIALAEGKPIEDAVRAAAWSYHHLQGRYYHADEVQEMSDQIRPADHVEA